MTLAFTSLKLKNFGPYYGEQAVDLETPEESPVVLIHGENTLGKTQLFAALRWCLYGAFQPQQSSSDVAASLRERFNRIAARQGDNDMEVQVSFTAGDTYLLTRRASLEGERVATFADLRVGPAVIPAADIEVEIGRLLHPQISEFFLFDAELLQRFYERLNTERERAFIRDSIESVLGIPALQLAARDVRDLAEDAGKRQARAAKDQTEATRLRDKLRTCATERASLESDRNQLHQDLRSAEEVRKAIHDEMAAVEGLEADAREQELLEARLVDAQKQALALRADLKGLVTKGWLAAAARPLAAALDSVREANTRAQREQDAIAGARMQVAVLQDRVQGGTCPACGQPLPKANETTQSELDDANGRLRALLEASGGGKVDLERERSVAALVDLVTAPSYKEKHDRLNELDMLEYELRRGLAGIADRLKGHSAADIRALGQRLTRTEDAIAKAQGDLEDIDKQLSIVGIEEQAAMRKLTKLVGGQPDAAIEATFFSYTHTLLGVTIDRYRETVRKEVEHGASGMFLRLIRDPDGYGGLRITADYHVEVLDRVKAPRKTSEGGRQLLALALIGALKHAAVRGGPVVLDSPLGRLDLEHRANVLQAWVPSLGNQAILLVQSGELTVDDGHRLLGSRIGREYRIVRPDGDPEHAVVERMR